MSIAGRMPLKFAGMLRALVVGLMVGLVGAAGGQTSVPPNQGSDFVDTSMLKPPVGAKVAIIEWEDLECPYCAHAFPLVQAAVKRYKIPLVRYDIHIPSHMWSHEAALTARYLEDKVSPELATEYRRAVFASQEKITNKDDLNRLTKAFFAAHGKELPLLIDPTGQLEREVRAGDALGHRLTAKMYTPMIVVVTPTAWIEVKDVAELNKAINQAEVEVGAHSAARP
jgi:protein-disulfide isomerase